MEHQLNDGDGGKPKSLDKNLSDSQFAHYKSHMDWLGIELRLLW
jgi:hypothetical protein